MMKLNNESANYKFEYETLDCSDEEFEKIKTNSKKKSNIPVIYWTSNTEKYLIEYNKSECQKERNKIYEDHLKFSFERLAENIFNTFKFSYFETSHEDAMRECVGFMLEKISKYDGERGMGSSFGYFSIVAKNYFILSNNATYKKWKSHDNIDPTPEHPREFIIDDHVKKNPKETSEFIDLMVSYWENNVNRMFTKQRDLHIANGIIHLFRHNEKIDFFNKKYLYLCIREISGCKTQQITKVINKMKVAQVTITKEYYKSGKITIKKTKCKLPEEDIEKIIFDSKPL